MSKDKQKEISELSAVQEEQKKSVNFNKLSLSCQGSQRKLAQSLSILTGEDRIHSQILSWRLDVSEARGLLCTIGYLMLSVQSMVAQFAQPFLKHLAVFHLQMMPSFSLFNHSSHTKLPLTCG